MIISVLNNIFKYKEKTDYEFSIPDVSNDLNQNEFYKIDEQLVSRDINENLDYLKSKYNMIINSDIKKREFCININNKDIPAFLIYIDGMVSDQNINEYILKPLLLKNSIKMQNNYGTNQILSTISFKKIDIDEFFYSKLIPQNNVIRDKKFKEIIPKINSGFCGLFVEGLENCFCIEVKGYKFRNIEKPITESIVKGSHQGFVENLRTNTSMLRRIINTEKLIIEETEVGNISKTKVSICYINNIVNDDLIAEVRYRINNLKTDYLLSSSQLEQFIIDNYNSSFPQIISTERPDKSANYLFLGRVVVLVDGSPFALVLPAVLIDFITSPEDFNLNYKYANFLRLLRLIALISALLVPGLYIAITTYHYELIPSELLYAIIDARKAIPFPIIFEILIMELCFELIQEASIRASSSFTTTIRNNWCTYIRRCCSIC